MFDDQGENSCEIFECSYNNELTCIVGEVGEDKGEFYYYPGPSSEEDKFLNEDLSLTERQKQEIREGYESYCSFDDSPNKIGINAIMPKNIKFLDKSELLIVKFED